MMNRTMSLALVAALALSPIRAESATGADPLPGWMAGAWLAEQPDGQWVEEWWSPAKAGIMLGAGRSGKGGSVDWWEQTRIEQHEGKTRFCALPKGQNGACFPATKVTETEAVFENPAHDFPTRVAYRREGAELVAEISGPNGANPQRWRFRRRD